MDSSTIDYFHADLQRACQALKRDAGVHLEWEWDGRMSSVLTAFSVNSRAEVKSWLQQAIPTCHDADDIANAQEAVQALANAWGGLRPGQLLFTRDATEEPMLFAAWWPWGNEQTISLRISCRAESDQAKRDGLSLVRGCFGV